MPFIPPYEIETQQSGSGSLSTSTEGLVSRDVNLRWTVHSMESYEAAEFKGNELAPLYYNGHRRTSLTPRPLGGGWYEIEAVYANAGVNAYQGVTWEGALYLNADGVTVVPASLSVDSTAKQEHITSAISFEDGDGIGQQKYARDGETAPNAYGAINVSGGRVGGVDRTVPTFAWTETWLVPAWYLVTKATEEPDASNSMMKDAGGASTPYANRLSDLSGSVNNEEFRGYPGGEVVFLGARFDTNRSSTMVPVSFSFSREKNLTDFKVGDIKVDYKDGQDHIDIVYEDVSESGSAVKRPKYVYVSQIAPRVDFNELMIGKDWPRFYLVGATSFKHPMVDSQKNLA